MPDFVDELRVSLAPVNSAKDRAGFSAAVDSFSIRNGSLEGCVRKQPAVKSPASRNPKREEFWSDYEAHGFRCAADKYIGIDEQAEPDRSQRLKPSNIPISSA